MGRPKKDQTVVVYARIPEHLAAELREEAIRDRRELSATIRLILESRHGVIKSPISKSQAEEIHRSAGEIDVLPLETTPKQVNSQFETQPSNTPKQTEDKHHSRAASKVSLAEVADQTHARRQADSSIESMVASRTKHYVGCNCFDCIQVTRFIEQQRKAAPAAPEKRKRVRK